MITKPPQLIECHVRGAVHYINIDSIIYFESKGHQLIITTINAQYVIRNSIPKFLAYLDATIFHQVHQSYAINVNYLIAFSSKEINLRGNYQIPIGRKYKDNFVVEMNKFLK